MHIATLNTHGIILPSEQATKRFVAMSQAFERVSPDILQLQEVWSYSQLLVLKRALSSYSFSYKPGLLGPTAGLVTLSHSRLPRSHYIDFPPVHEPKKRKAVNRWKRNLKKKGILVTHLTEQCATINAHLVANGDGNWCKTNRYYAAHQHDIEQLANIVVNLGQQTRHILVTGDFNIPKESDLYHQFVAASHVRDAFGQEDLTPTFHASSLPPGKEAHCIDYIFLRSDQICVRNTARLFQEKVQLPDGNSLYVSDHIGLLAELSNVSLSS